MVLLVLPLTCFERTTIGFRLQKLEMHFNAAYPGPGASMGGAAAAAPAGSVVAIAAAGGSDVFACVRDDVGGGMSPRLSVSPRSSGEALEERTSVVILTRDR